jgi:hypothetical protein
VRSFAVAALAAPRVSTLSVLMQRLALEVTFELSVVRGRTRERHNRVTENVLSTVL